MIQLCISSAASKKQAALSGVFTRNPFEGEAARTEPAGVSRRWASPTVATALLSNLEVLYAV